MRRRPAANQMTNQIIIARCQGPATAATLRPPRTLDPVSPPRFTAAGPGRPAGTRGPKGCHGHNDGVRPQRLHRPRARTASTRPHPRARAAAGRGHLSRRAAAACLPLRSRCRQQQQAQQRWHGPCPPLCPRRPRRAQWRRAAPGRRRGRGLGRHAFLASTAAIVSSSSAVVPGGGCPEEGEGRQGIQLEGEGQRLGRQAGGSASSAASSSAAAAALRAPLPPLPRPPAAPGPLRRKARSSASSPLARSASPLGPLSRLRGARCGCSRGGRSGAGLDRGRRLGPEARQVGQQHVALRHLGSPGGAGGLRGLGGSSSGGSGCRVSRRRAAATAAAMRASFSAALALALASRSCAARRPRAACPPAATRMKGALRVVVGVLRRAQRSHGGRDGGVVRLALCDERRG